MRIAILTSGILPIPAVLGGAVENLIDYYLEYNNQHSLHDISVYSVAPPHSIPNANTNVGAIAEVSQGNAIIVNKTSASTEIAQSILKLYNLPSLCISMRNAGLALSQQYAKDRYAKDFFNSISLKSNN